MNESPIMTVYPRKRPNVWSIRTNWDVPNGLYYNPTSGEMFSVSKEPYVLYIGRIPEEYLEKQQQLTLVGT